MSDPSARLRCARGKGARWRSSNWRAGAARARRLTRLVKKGSPLPRISRRRTGARRRSRAFALGRRRSGSSPPRKTPESARGEGQRFENEGNTRSARGGRVLTRVVAGASSSRPAAPFSLGALPFLRVESPRSAFGIPGGRASGCGRRPVRCLVLRLNYFHQTALSSPRAGTGACRAAT
jgi:hypothetical protein